MSKLIRDVVMHWIYIEVWLTAKPFLYLLKIEDGVLEKRYSRVFCAQLCISVCQDLSSIIFLC